MSKIKVPTFPLYQALDVQPLRVTLQTPINDVIHLMSQASVHCCHSPLRNSSSSEPPAPAQHTSCVLVMDNHRLAGILTEKDIVRLIATKTVLTGRTAADVMTHPVKTLPAEEGLDIYLALNAMRRHSVHHLPVVDAQGEVIGLLTPKRLRSLMEPANFMRFRLVLEVMKAEVIYAPPTASVLQIVRQLLTHRVSCVVIVNETEGRITEGRITEEQTAERQTAKRQADALLPVGIVTERDIVQIHRQGLDLEKTQAQDVMSAPLFWVSPQNSLWEVDQIMRSRKVRRLVVADEQGRLAGIVTQSDLLPVDPIVQQSVYATARDITERKEMERALRIRVKQQAAVASLGQVALASDDLNELMNAVVVTVAQTLEIEYCKVLELLPDGESLRLKAGVGWQPELMGTALISTGQDSQAGYTLRTSNPVVVTDLRTEPRFRGTTFLRDRNIISGMSAVVQGQQKPYGTLCVHATQLRSFSDEDVAFLQSVANLLAQAIEQKNAQAIVSQSEHEYRTLAENLPGIVYRVFPGEQWRMVFLNEQCQALTGFTSEELKSGEVCSIDPLIVSEDRPQVIAAVRAGVAQQMPFQVEYRIQDKAGNIRYFWEKGQPIAARNGQPAYIDGVIFDVSDRHQAQQTIEEQAALLNVATDAILVYGLTGEILFWNKGAESIYGWSAEEALSQNVYRLLYPDDYTDNEDNLLKLAPTGSWQGELQQVTKQNQVIIVMSRWTLVKDKQGNPTSILSVDTDITAAKQLETQFLRAQRLESIGSLASGIAHDLNNIMTPIYGVSQLLSMQFPDANESIQEQFQLLQTSAKRGSKIIDQVLSFARGEDGDRAPLAIRHLIAELKSFAIKTFPKSLRITTNAPGELWTVNADATQLYQVFMNLFVNARDAMPNGGQLSLSAINLSLDESSAASHLDARVGAYILVTVSDSGTGIPADQCDRIFEPFFSTKRSTGGTGLGLSTVHSIVKNHGGFITVCSELGKGTQFKVYLPAIASADTSVEAPVAFPAGNGERLLIVDDEKPICDMARLVLESHNYRVLVAEDGIDAIAQYTEHKADIAAILINMTMPSLDGATAIRILRKMSPDLNIIAVSGLPGNERVVASLGESVSAFLPKPYSAAILLQTVHGVVG